MEVDSKVSESRLKLLNATKSIMNSRFHFVKQTNTGLIDWVMMYKEDSLNDHVFFVWVCHTYILLNDFKECDLIVVFDLLSSNDESNDEVAVNILINL
jgi:hypothetical protein